LTRVSIRGKRHGLLQAILVLLELKH
jgi:hypothetical protein